MIKAKEMLQAKQNLVKNLVDQRKEIADSNIDHYARLAATNKGIEDLKKEAYQALSKGDDIRSFDKKIEALEDEKKHISAAIENANKTIEEVIRSCFTSQAQDVISEYAEFYNQIIKEISDSEQQVIKKNNEYNKFIESIRDHRKELSNKLSSGYAETLTALQDVIPFESQDYIRSLDKQTPFYNKDLQPIK